METTTVYRIQHSVDSTGPYFGSLGLEKVLDYSASRHPTPAEDGINCKNKKLVCGFADLNAMADWFSESDAKFLQTMGFIVAVYKVPVKSVLFGGRQLMFPPAETPSEVLSISTCGAWPERSHLRSLAELISF